MVIIYWVKSQKSGGKTIWKHQLSKVKYTMAIKILWKRICYPMQGRVDTAECHSAECHRKATVQNGCSAEMGNVPIVLS